MGVATIDDSMILRDVGVDNGNGEKTGPVKYLLGSKEGART